MNRVWSSPGPSSKFGAAVVGKGLFNFCAGIHDKRAMLGDRLPNGAALQYQQLTAGVAGMQGAVLRGV
jgi:hypothetical protein